MKITFMFFLIYNGHCIIHWGLFHICQYKCCKINLVSLVGRKEGGENGPDLFDRNHSTSTAGLTGICRKVFVNACALKKSASFSEEYYVKAEGRRKKVIMSEVFPVRADNIKACHCTYWW